MIFGIVAEKIDFLKGRPYAPVAVRARRQVSTLRPARNTDTQSRPITSAEP
mgnify:CR=1 FL=1